MAEENKEKDKDPTVEIAKINQTSTITIARLGLISTFITVVIGGLIVAFSNPELLEFLSQNQTLTPTIVVSAPSTETATFVPPTASLTPTFTLVPTKTSTPVPTQVTSAAPTMHLTSIPGQDWLNDCIDLHTWQPSLPGDTTLVVRDCSQLARWGITAQDGKLFIDSWDSESTAREYGLMTRLPTRATITLDIDVKHLKGSEIWVGVFDADQKDRFSGVVFVIQPGSAMDFREMPQQKPVVDNQYYQYVDKHFPLTIALDVGKISIIVNKNKLISNYPLNFTDRELFVGYRSLPNTEIDVSISDLQILSP